MKLKLFLLRNSKNKKWISIAGKIYHLLWTIIGEDRADYVLSLFSKGFYSSPGLIFERYGYHHPYMYKFIWEVQEYHRTYFENVPKRGKLPLGVSGDRIKVGIFEGLMVPHKDLFINKPDNVDLFIYDNQNTRGLRAEWLEKIAKGYYCAKLQGEPKQILDASFHLIEEPYKGHKAELESLVEKINEDNLDVLLHIGGVSKDWDYIIDCATSKIIINYATGSIISFNQKVDLDIFMQPQRNFNVKGDRIYCDYLGEYFNQVPLKEFSFVFNHRGMTGEDLLPIDKRKKRLVFHGNLYKLYNKSALKLIANLLKKNVDFEFVFFGADQKDYASKILRYFKKEQVSSRVSYLGVFEYYPDVNGNYSSVAWNDMANILKESRLYIDPWPICGGNTVYQAYMLGIPCVSMMLNDQDVGKRMSRDETLVEVAGLNTPMNFVKTHEEFETLCQRLIDDDALSQNLIEKQLDCAIKLSKEEAFKQFWEIILNAAKDEGNNERKE